MVFLTYQYRLCPTPDPASGAGETKLTTDKFKRLAELDKFWSLKSAIEHRDFWRAERTRRWGPSLPPEEPLTDREAEEHVRLLIRYLADEIGEQRRDELLAWLDTVTVKRRLLEES